MASTIFKNQPSAGCHMNSVCQLPSLTPQFGSSLHRLFSFSFSKNYLFFNLEIIFLIKINTTTISSFSITLEPLLLILFHSNLQRSSYLSQFYICKMSSSNDQPDSNNKGKTLIVPWNTIEEEALLVHGWTYRRARWLTSTKMGYLFGRHRTFPQRNELRSLHKKISNIHKFKVHEKSSNEV